MATLSDLASLRKAFYRLVDTEADDPALTEHGSSENEVVDQLLTYGAHDAQDFLLAANRGDLWLSEVGVPTESSWQGSENTDGGRYTDLSGLSESFLRLAGDEEISALREDDGEPWGKLVDWHTHRKRLRGNYYWIEGERLWIARGASPPSDLEMHYHYRISLPTGSTDVDFPAADRPLIVAYAGQRALNEPWAPGGEELERKVARNLEYQKQRSRSRNRTSRQPRQMQQRQMVGTHWF